MGHSMTEAVREDALAIWRRDPACETLLEAVLFMKGFLALVIHRAARRAWKPVEDGRDGNEKGIGNENQNDGGNGQNGGANVNGKRFVALMLQSLASSAFGVDIHPAAQIGKGVMIDHATGVVIGETATVGDGTTILHGVTLGGTGKESGELFSIFDSGGMSRRELTYTQYMSPCCTHSFELLFSRRPTPQGWKGGF